MKNFIQAGSNITIAAPAAVLSGGVVIAGEIKGVAAGAAATGELVDVVTTGVFELPKVSADAFALGAPVYWNNTTHLATTTVGSNTKLGVAIAAAAAGVGTVKVRLSGF